MFAEDIWGLKGNKLKFCVFFSCISVREKGICYKNIISPSAYFTCHLITVVHSLSHVQLCWLHGLQGIGLLCPSLSPRVCSNSCPLSLWWCLIISSSVTPFSSCPLSFPASESFPVSQLFTSSGQSIGTSASASVLLMNIQGWFPLGLISLISLQPKGFSGVFSSTVIQKHQFACAQPSLWSISHIHTWLLEKPKLWLYGPLMAKWCLCFLIYCLGLS